MEPPPSGTPQRPEDASGLVEVPLGSALTQEERALIQGCRRGERGAMKALYEKYIRKIHNLVARIVGASEADEVTQEIFLRALRGIHTFRGESALSTWMYRLAVNASLSHASRAQQERRRQVNDALLDGMPAGRYEPDGEHRGDPILHGRLSRAMGQLPAGYRAVLVLHDIEGLQHDEISSILGIQVGTSKSQLHKARARMRELLESI